MRRLPDLRRIARIAMVGCTREAKFEEVQRHYIQIYAANFCYVTQNLSPFNICKN